MDFSTSESTATLLANCAEMERLSKIPYGPSQRPAQRPAAPKPLVQPTQREELRRQLEERKKNRSGSGFRPGMEARFSIVASAAGASGSAAAEWKSRLSELTVAGMAPVDALVALQSQNPALHQRYLAEFNAANPQPFQAREQIEAASESAPTTASTSGETAADQWERRLKTIMAGGMSRGQAIEALAGGSAHAEYLERYTREQEQALSAARGW